MKKIISIILINLMIISSLNSTTLSSEAKGKAMAPLQNILKTTQWDLFMTEFEITMEQGFCGEGLKKAIGLKATSIEPIGYFETSRKRLHFAFADFDIDEGGDVKTSVSDSSWQSGPDSGSSSSVESAFNKIMMFGSPRSDSDDDANQGGRDNLVWSHFIYAPIFGLLFKKKMKFLCLAGGDIALPVLSEFLPGYTKDIVFINMIPQMIAMFSPQALLTSILDCGASMGVNSMHGFVSGENALDGSELTSFIDDNNAMDPNRESSNSDSREMDEQSMNTEEALNSIRNTMFWNVGCLGFSPVGGYISGDDPGTDNELIGFSMLNILHGASAILPKPLLMKQSNFSVSGTPNGNDGKPINPMNSMCKPQKYPMMIQSQYLFQRAGMPTTGRAHALGVSGAVSTTAANVPQSADDWVNMVWQYRDYYAFAYFCPSN